MGQNPPLQASAAMPGGHAVSPYTMAAPTISLGPWFICPQILDMTDGLHSPRPGSWLVGGRKKSACHPAKI